MESRGIAAQLIDFSAWGGVVVLGVVAVGSLVLAPTAEAQTTDHLSCFKLKDPQKVKAQAGFDAADDAFDVGPGCKIKGQALFYCVPSVGTVDAPTLEIDKEPAALVPFTGQPASSKLCYKVSCPKTSVDDQVVFDPFGSRTFEMSKVGMVCAPTEVGAPSKRVFVTSNDTLTGNLGGLAGADAICQAAADSASLGGTYKAWLSDTLNNPANRFTQSEVPYALVNGTEIAANWDDLVDGSIANPIDRDESGSPVPFLERVWTGTLADGTRATLDQICLDWTSDQMVDQGSVGSTIQTSSSWTVGVGFDCDSQLHLYCFEQ